MKSLFINMKIMFAYSWRVSKRIFFTTFIQIILDTIEPLFMVILPKFIIDELTTGKRWDITIKYIALFITFIFVTKGLRLLLDVYINATFNKIQSKTGKEYFNDFLSMDYELLEDSNFRDLSAKIKYNVRCANFIGTDMAEFITNLLIFISFSSVMLYNSNILIFLVILATTVIWHFISIRHEKWKHHLQQPIAKNNRKFGYLYSTMIDFAQAKDLRVNKMSDLLLHNYEEQIKIHTKLLKKNTKKENVFSLLNIATTLVRDLVFYIYAAFSFLKDKISLGDFTVLTGSILNTSNSLLALIKKINYFRVFSKNISEYSTYKKMVTPRYMLQDTNEIAMTDYTLVFKNVFFKYPNTSDYILKDVNLTINNNEKLGIVGLNGAGKTSLIKLICRLYKPNRGQIFLNGHDIYSIDYYQYISSISVIFQDFQLFAFSIYDNIVLGKTFNSEKFQSVLKLSGLDGKIKQLHPNREHTMITKEFDEAGVDLSGGESQKLVLARALYKNSRMIILDEPTAAMDPIAEYEFYQHFNELSSQKTVIYISHRLAATKFCDKIAVIANGAVEEYGSHEELIAKQGIYKELFQYQASLYKGNEEDLGNP